jgi:chromosome segregation ATPase
MGTRAASPQSIPTTVDPALEIFKNRDDMLDREVVLRGRIDKDIERLIKIKEEAEAKLGTVTTLEAATRVKAEADTYAEKTRAEADQLKAAASALREDADKRSAIAQAKERSLLEFERTLASRETAVTAERERLQASAIELDQRGAALNTNYTKIAEELDALNKTLAADHASKMRLLTEREKRLNSRLEALKVVDF